MEFRWESYTGLGEGFSIAGRARSPMCLLGFFNLQSEISI